MPRRVVNPASAAGEEVGRLIAEAVERGVEEIVRGKGFIMRSKERLKNRWKGRHEIDIVIHDAFKGPVILIDVKYLRYKKHCRDKASRTCTAHSSLTETYPSIRKTVAILAGNWTEPSKEQLKSYGIEVFHIPFEHIAKVLGEKGVPFEWDEKDKETPQRAWNALQTLSEEEEKREIGKSIIAPVLGNFRKFIADILDEILHRRAGRPGSE